MANNILLPPRRKQFVGKRSRLKTLICWKPSMKEQNRWFLRFIIDKGGVSMDDCVAVTEAAKPSSR